VTSKKTTGREGKGEGEDSRARTREVKAAS